MKSGFQRMPRFTPVFKTNQIRSKPTKSETIH